MDFDNIVKYAQGKGYSISTRVIPGIVDEQVICLRPDGYEQVFYKREGYLNFIKYEIDNYVPFNSPIDKKQRFGLKDFGVKNIKNFLAGTINEFRDKTMGLPEHEKKQYELRYSICTKCKHNNSRACDQNTTSLDVNGALKTGCGCDFPGLTYAPSKVCPLGKWVEILDKDSYDKYLKDGPILLSEEFSKVEDYAGGFKIFKAPTINKSAVSEDTDKVEIDFYGYNSLDKAIQIDSISSSCGCTVPNYPKHVIVPGEEFVVKAIFNPKGRIGLNSKSLTVLYKDGHKDILKFNISVFANDKKK